MGISEGRAAAFLMWLGGLSVGIGSMAENAINLILFAGIILSVAAIFLVRSTIAE